MVAKKLGVGDPALAALAGEVNEGQDAEEHKATRSSCSNWQAWRSVSDGILVGAIVASLGRAGAGGRGVGGSP